MHSEYFNGRRTRKRNWFRHISKNWRQNVRERKSTIIRVDLVGFRWRALKAAQFAIDSRFQFIKTTEVNSDRLKDIRSAKSLAYIYLAEVIGIWTMSATKK